MVLAGAPRALVTALSACLSVPRLCTRSEVPCCVHDLEPIEPRGSSSPIWVRTSLVFSHGLG